MQPRRTANEAALVEVSASDKPRSPEEKRRAMSWAQRLKRVFGIDVTTCVHCGGAVLIMASIEEPNAIRAILGHFEKHDALEQPHYRLRPRGPPAAAMAAWSQDRPRPPTTKTNSHQMRRRSRRGALGPAPGFSEKWPRTTRLRAHVMPKFSSRRPDPCPNRRLRGRRLHDRLPKKGV
jgi:hypothetical protein